MYTALKLLGREKRYEWWATILAWYDDHLKDEPELWQRLYPES